MRLVLIHWKPEEARERVADLERAGFETTVLAPNGSAGLKGTLEFASAVLIDLSRLPLQGRAVAIELRKRASTRRLPVVFVGGAPEKVDAIRQVLPDAAYLEWRDLASALPDAIRNAPETPVLPDTMAGYSGRPLAAKLGLRENAVVALLNAPEEFDASLEPLPAGVVITKSARGATRAVLFVRNMRDLERRCEPTLNSVAEGATVWIAWPKQTSGIPADVTQALVRAHGLDRGWVDYKICAIDKVWSGLAFSRRKRVKV